MLWIMLIHRDLEILFMEVDMKKEEGKEGVKQKVSEKQQEIS